MKLKNILKPIIKQTMYLFQVFPIQQNKVVFSAFSARTYGDNPRFIAEEIASSGKNVDCVFVLDHPDRYSLPLGIRTVRHNTVKYLYEMATAKFWVDNTRKQPHIIKRRGQKYIQTWHGAIAFKMIEKDVQGVLDEEYVRTAIHDSSQIDYLLTNSKWGEDMLRRCFWYDGKILRTGSARLDILFRQTQAQKQAIRDQLKIPARARVLLYAPTFRKSKRMDVYDIDYSRLQSALETRFGGKWKIMVKLHPNISDLRYNIPDYVIDATLYPDINELYGISDALITDYSSSILDYSVLRKPAFVYACDIEEYSQDRSTYFDIRALPFPLAENNEQLNEQVLHFDEGAYLNDLTAFHEELDLLEDGHASQRVADLIYTIMDEKEDGI